MAGELSIETIMQLAQQLQGTPAPQVDTRAPDNELGLLGRMLGSAGANAGLSTAQQEMQARRALMAWGTQVTDAATRYMPYGERSFMGAIGEGNRAAWDTSANYETLARQQAKEDREERRQQFSDRISALEAAGKIGKMQQELQLLALRGKGLDVGQGGTDTAGGGGGGGGSGKFTGDMEKDRKIIIAQESGGDPKAMNYVAKADPSAWDRGATATGKYQFVTSTWKEGLKLAGYNPDQYARAMDAPEAVQDKVFEAIYKQRGSAPWDSSKWGRNWQKGPEGKYTLTASDGTGAPTRGGGVAARTGGTDVAGPPGTVPIKTPAAPAAPAAPAQLATADDLDSGKALAAQSGKPVAIPKAGLWVLPNGNVTSVRPGGTFGEGTATAERGAPTPPPPGVVPPAATPPAPAGPPPGAPPGTPPVGEAPPAAPPKEPDDTIGLPPGVPGYRAFRAANLRQPTPEERATFGGELTAADKASVAEERQQLERALKNANTAYQQGTGESGAVVTAQKNLADHIERVRKAGAEADAKGKEREAKFWENQETQLRQAHKELITGAETRLTADNAAKNARITKINEGVDSDVAQTSERISSLEALRTLSAQVGKPTLLGDVRIGNRTLADIITSTGWGGPELAKKAGDIQTFQAAVNAAIKDIKSGVAMGAVSDRDMIFLENMVANPKQDERTRNLIITGLIAAQERKRDVAMKVGNLIASGTPPHQAILQAHKDTPPIFRQVPPDIDKGGTKERGDWFRDNVRPGQLYRRGDGTVDVYPGPEG